MGKQQIIGPSTTSYPNVKLIVHYWAQPCWAGACESLTQSSPASMHAQRGQFQVVMGILIIAFRNIFRRLQHGRVIVIEIIIPTITTTTSCHYCACLPASHFPFPPGHILFPALGAGKGEKG